MVRNILQKTVATICLLIVATISIASIPTQGVAEQEKNSDISVSIDGSKACVKGAQGMTLEVVSLTGKSVLTAKIDSISQHISLDIPKGCYILKVGDATKKVIIR